MAFPMLMSNLDRSQRTPTAPYTWRQYVFFVIMAGLGLVVLPFLAGVATGHWELFARNRMPSQQGTVECLHVFWEAWTQIEQQFFAPTPLDPQGMTRGAVNGMLASLNDPYTLFVEPSQHRLETDRLEGQFGGIGVSLDITDKQVVVDRVHADSPAEQAGVQVGDVLLSVYGMDLDGLSADEVVLLIRGPVGSMVQLRVRRGDQEELDLVMIRQQIEVPSLAWQLMPDGIGYIYIYRFTARTGAEFSAALRLLGPSNVRALVLDLRGNGGGLVDGAVQVLGHLIGHGIAYRELSKEGETRYAIPFEADAIDWPLAVLVDGASASAAEIVASALQDYGRGILFGEPTSGKGSMQGIFLLSDGSSLHVTTARWLSPHGHPIQGVGVQPDIVISAVENKADADLVLQRAIDHLHHQAEAHVTAYIM
ncbi:MAG: S41 family peptidase [Chloroflexi bacterium]|nr:S41 family peptidase [Chloroflexota bacterium]